MPRSMIAPIAALFPGQGVSLAGARELVAARCLPALEHCCELLGEDPFERAGETTRFAQPAVFLAGVAGWHSVEDATPAPVAFAGHSLGELTALTAAAVFALEDATSLVVLRGSLMADAAERDGHGGMLAILKGTADDAHALARAHGVQLANDNAEGQTILSGHHDALAEAAEAARGRGLRAIRLDVAGAFHSRAMEPARGPFLDALAEVKIQAPRAPVYSGMTAAPFQDVRAELARALARPVRWRETMLALRAAGVGRYLDVGPDRVLARLTERNLPGVEALTLSDGIELEMADGVRA